MSDPLGVLIDRDGGAHEIKREEQGTFLFDEDDYLLFALIADPVYCAELLGEDPGNRDYAGAYHVRDYQYPLFRLGDFGNYAGAACARSTGKTESIKWRAVSHTFRRIRENLLLTAPELIHLLPLTDAVEGLIRSIRLCRDFLDTRNGKTGFTHRPFGVDFLDGTKIVGRIPRLTGTGVKGQHQPDLMIDEAQDYPERGWTEVHETVLKDHTDIDGEADFTYHFYGVHSGAHEGGFHRRTTDSEEGFKVLNVTALQRPGWSASEKRAAKAAYGSTDASDYRRNILGEQGAPASAYFVTARLMMCLDQNRESDYNVIEYRHQEIKYEVFKELDLEIGDMLDLPSGYGNVWVGVDFGLTDAPTVVTIWNEAKYGTRTRLKLIRRITFWRMRTRVLREALYAIAWHYGLNLRGVGLDTTGLGAPIWQEMEDDESAPKHLLEVTRGYFFNSKVPIHVDEQNVSKDDAGRMRDQYGNVVVEEVDADGMLRYVTYLPMIESSTKYLREWVDTTFLLMPFDAEITRDMQGETQQRVQRVGQLGGLRQKPNAFHILDSMRAMAQRYHAEEIEQMLEEPEQDTVLDRA